MKKGHYGHYTGNARHSRKEEMIHDREMIYDAKTQIHNEDEKYKHTGKSGYKQDMIHERELIHDTKTQLHHADSDYKGDSPAHLSYSSEFGGLSLKDAESTGAYANYDGGAASQVSAMRQKAQGLSNMTKSLAGSLSDLAGKKKKEKEGNDNKTKTYKTRGMEITPISLPKSNIPPIDTSFVKDSKTTVEASVKTKGKTYTDRMAYANLSKEDKSKYGNSYDKFHKAAQDWRDTKGKIKNITFDNKTRDKDASDPLYN